MTTDDPRPLADSLAYVARNLGLAPPTELAAVLAHWTELVGDALALHARPASLRKGVLTIEVEDGAWGAPLKYLGDTLVRRANEVLGASAVTTIKVVTRPVSGARTPRS